jgi:threonine/homoserine/homoserine lactone efflux protein
LFACAFIARPACYALIIVRTVDSTLLTYLTFTFLLAVTPGSTTAVVVRNTLIGGRAAGLAAAAGAALGNTSHATAAGLGLAVIFARWPLALAGLRIAGAVFLAWLGARSVYRVVKHPDGGMRILAANEPPSSGKPTDGSFRQGLAINLLNPSIATFYLVVVPSFLPAAAPRWYFAVLAAMHVAIAFACHGMWAVALDKLRQLFRAPLARRVLEGVTGLALLWLATRILITT